MPTTAQTLVASLAGHGVDRVFCVAGESYLPVLDALHDSGIDVVTCRHEGSAAFMAVADAKLTGRAGVCLVSRGPGAANAAVAVHAAAEDGTPLLLLVGGVAEAEIDQEVFQSLDSGRFFGGIAKAAWTLHDPAAAASLAARAFRLAESGTPGPVILTLPEDVLAREDPIGVPSAQAAMGATLPGGASLRLARRLLAQACRPLLLAGGRLSNPEGRELIRKVAERHGLPVVTSNKHQHLLPGQHPSYAGMLHNATQSGQLSAFLESDLVLAVGTRLDSVTTKDHSFPGAGQRLVHVYPDAARIGSWHPVDLGVDASPAAFLAEMATWEPSSIEDGWTARLHQLEADKAVWEPAEAADGVVFGAVMAELGEQTGGDLNLVVDSGTFTSWAYRYVRLGERGRLLGLGSSSMGFGVGAGVAAALRSDGTPTVVVIGDGGFVMNPGELITACARRLPLVVIVANNGSYGTIRLHQELHHPGRIIATDLANPDFARLAEAFGALGLRVDSTEQIRPALAKALGSGGPAVIEVRTSLKHITAYRRI
ncbi:thiamine pyrophosphate-dependent enzyme [Longispora albida]|uniref:thiamine pyrophosphate-dependent enzyme n=1 Tax=Longispora albida TaxID=203523 RepID=UPI000371D7A8|nr:thiamine pyrophosphate-dependent enzyme [Longispora albida]